MLDGVRDPDLLLLYAGLLQRLSQHAPRRADEGLTLAVLQVARLLPDEDEVRVARSRSYPGQGP